MELQFSQTTVPYLRPAVWELQSQEQTQELRLPDGMPDAGTVLGAWGQTVLRSKEWRSDEMTASGGVMVWLLYTPEDGSEPRKLETWIPFQMRWDFPQTPHEGIMRIKPALRSVDARLISARKMMVRASVSALGEAWEPAEAAVASPGPDRSQVQLLTRNYPVRIPKEAGEKTFALDEELNLPASCPGIANIVRYEMNCDLQDQKVIGARLVFRGTAVLHIVYQAADGRFQTWDYEIPFSQYTDLDHDYEQDAQGDIQLAVTGMELDGGENDMLRFKCGFVAQYLVEDREMLQLAEDAYAPHREVELQMDSLRMPVILDSRKELLRLENTVSVDSTQTVDVSFLPELPRLHMAGENARAELGGTFQVLYYDDRNDLQCALSRWEHTWEMPAGQGLQVQLAVQPGTKPLASIMGGDIQLKGELHLTARTISADAMPMLTGVTLGEETAPDPNRPSLILRRAGEESLWSLAKRCGTTVSAIQEANCLNQEPVIGQMLLIPVP